MVIEKVLRELREQGINDRETGLAYTIDGRAVSSDDESSESQDAPGERRQEKEEIL